MSYANYNQGAPQGQPAGISNIPYQLTREEKRVLRECAQESFYNRCVPLMTAFGLGAYYAVHFGYTKGHVTYGAGPKVVFGLIAGYIGGKFSYRKACEDKVLRLPGGRLKETILLQRQGNTYNPIFGGDDREVYGDTTNNYAVPSNARGPFRLNEPNLASELDTERHIDSFDDSFKIRSDENGTNLPSTLPSRSVSYDELRNRNRDEYDNRRKQYRVGGIDDHSSSLHDGLVSGSHNAPPSYSTDQFNRPSSDYSASDNYGLNRYANSQPPNQRAPLPRTNFYGDAIEK